MITLSICGRKLDICPEVDDDMCETDAANLTQQIGGKFTPAKVTEVEHSKFTGVKIMTFPKGTDDCQIFELLLESGLPATKIDDILIKQNGTVLIKKLTSVTCSKLISSLHNKVHFARKIFL